MKATTQAITFRIPKGVYIRMRALAKVLDVPQATLVTTAIDRYTELRLKEEPRLEEAFDNLIRFQSKNRSRAGEQS